MRRNIYAGLLVLMILLIASRTSAPVPVHAEPLPENTRKLLEQSLSLVEIDREIERVAAIREQTIRQIETSRERLSRQEAAIQTQREKAGDVLRAYYMGRSDFILESLLRSSSLTELLRTWEMMDFIIRSDRATLDQYAEQYAELRASHEQLQLDEAELAAVEVSLQRQRERLLKLQDEIDKALAASGDEAHLRQLMAELEAYWNNVGLFEVRRYFRALAEAMQDLPAWIQDNPGMLQTKGLTAKVTLTDDQLNAFLREQDERFKYFEIAFAKDRMIAMGDNGNIQVRIEGHYTLQQKPVNAIIFHVDALVFNGLALPDMTRADLERQFDLGFYPQNLIKYVKANRVAIEPGKLIMEFGIG